MRKPKPVTTVRKGDGYLWFLVISGFSLFLIAALLYADSESRFAAFRRGLVEESGWNAPVMLLRNGVGIPDCLAGAPERFTLWDGTSAFRCPS